MSSDRETPMDPSDVEKPRGSSEKDQFEGTERFAGDVEVSIEQQSSPESKITEDFSQESPKDDDLEEHDHHHHHHQQQQQQQLLMQDDDSKSRSNTTSSRNLEGNGRILGIAAVTAPHTDAPGNVKESTGGSGGNGNDDDDDDRHEATEVSKKKEQESNDNATDTDPASPTSPKSPRSTLPKTDARKGEERKLLGKGKSAADIRSNRDVSSSMSSVAVVDCPTDFTLAEKLVWEIVPERPIRLVQTEQVGSWYNQHTTYWITDDRTGLQVRRRYNDFVWLRIALEKLLPKCFIPPIPAKQAFGRFDGAFIFRRQKGLQRFLNRLNENPAIEYHPAFVSFMIQTDPKLFTEDQEDQEKLIKQLEKKKKVSGKKPGVDSSKPEEEREVSHDLTNLKPTAFVTQLRVYLMKFKRGLEVLNKSRAKLNEDQKAQSTLTLDLGQSFESILQMESSAPFHSDTFMSSVGRQHVDLQKLTQWNTEHMTLRDESFADGLNDYTILVTEFLKFVKNFEEGELRPFDTWREAYIGAKLQPLKKEFEGAAIKSKVKEKLSEALAKDSVYLQVSKNFFVSFDQFLTECELFFANRSLEMKIIMRSFVASWKLYSQAVVGCLQENLAVIGEMNGHLSFSPLVLKTKGRSDGNGPHTRTMDGSESTVDFDQSSTMLSLMDTVTGDQFEKTSFAVRLDTNRTHNTSPPDQSSVPKQPPPPSRLDPLTTSVAFQSDRGNLLRDIQTTDPQVRLRPVGEEEKNWRVSNFDPPASSLEISNLFSQITGLRTRLGYGKAGAGAGAGGGEQPQTEPTEETDEVVPGGETG